LDQRAAAIQTRCEQPLGTKLKPKPTFSLRQSARIKEKAPSPDDAEAKTPGMNEDDKPSESSESDGEDYNPDASDMEDGQSD
jgi:hypothetical protein